MFKVIARKECHLCDDLINALDLYQNRLVYEVTYIDDNPELERPFGQKVPVLLKDDQELCHYFLDKDVLESYL